MQLTKNFTLEELIASDTARARGIINIPTDEQGAELLRLAVTVLQPIRDLLGVPMKITSGFRCKALNYAIGGVEGSQHLAGQAADFVTPDMDINLAFDKIKESDIPYDQLIWEWKGWGTQWIHVSCHRAGEAPRRQVLKLHQPRRRPS